MKADKKPPGGAEAAVLETLFDSSHVFATEKGNPKPAASLRIVLLEDSEADAELIHATLLDAGLSFSMTTVSSLEGLERELSQRRPNIILSDFWLTTFDGGDALEVAKQVAPSIPFIFVTGILGEEVVIEMLKRGATDYVLKNRLARLAPAVSRALRESEHVKEHQKAQANLRRSYDQLRALTGHLQFVREEERARIALEVHDELGQALTGLKIDLSWLAGKIGSDRVLNRKIKAMSSHVDDTILTVRRIATELRPGVLDSLGLAAAIEWQAAEFTERSGIACNVKIEVKEERWDREFSTVCFRVFQETLTNVLRHAEATHVDVRLAQAGDELVLTVHDNGRGISEKEIVNARSIGIIGMRERVSQVGGHVFFFGLPKQGTTVTMRVPMPKSLAEVHGPA
jgi:signal transduction histidine kinase